MKKYSFVFFIISLIFFIGCDSNQDTISVEEDKANNIEKRTGNVINKYVEEYNAVNISDKLKEFKFRYTIELKKYIEEFDEKPFIFTGSVEDIYEKNNEIYAVFDISKYSLLNMFAYMQLKLKCSEKLTERLLKEGKGSEYDYAELFYSIFFGDYVICAYINSVDRIEFVATPRNEEEIELRAGRTVVLIGEMVDYTRIGYK